jgi:Helicase associated domain
MLHVNCCSSVYLQNTLVPRKYPDDPDLSAWVEMMRALWNRDYHSQADPNLYVRETINSPIDANVDATLTSLPFDSRPSDFLTESGDEAAVGLGSITDDAAAVAVLHGLIGAPVSETLDFSLPTNGLTSERKEKLDNLGFVWCVRMKQFDDHWDEMFRQLIQYREKHGDCLVPSRCEENVRLGKWVETQRYEYTKMKRAEQTGEMEAAKSTPSSRLTADRQRKLESIGFEWTVKNKMKRYYDKKWEEIFERLLAYKQKFGNTRVPKVFDDDPKL